VRPPGRSGRRGDWGPRRAVTAAGIGLLAVTVGGAALALWTSSGTGTGSGTTASLTLTGETTTSGLLAPGATSVVHLTLTNPNPGEITIVALTGGTARIAESGSGSCDPAAVTFVPRADLTVPVPAGGSVVVDGVVSMSTEAADGCQGATFTVPVTARAETS